MNWALDLAEQWKHREGIANAFGIVLYTDEHPHIKKALADDDYWSALDEMSGPRWAVFSIRAQPGRYEYPKPPPGVHATMVCIWKEPRENKPLLREFEIKSTERLPVFLVFAKGDDGEILTHSIPLDDSSVEKAYDSLKYVIKVVTKAIGNVSIENLKSAEGVHGAIGLAVTNYKEWRAIKKGVSFYKWVKDLLP